MNIHRIKCSKGQKIHPFIKEPFHFFLLVKLTKNKFAKISWFSDRNHQGHCLVHLQHIHHIVSNEFTMHAMSHRNALCEH